MFDNLTVDLRHAVRHIRRAPGFALTVVATIAITIGASSTLFSLYYALVMRSLPVSDPSRIVLVQPVDEKGQSRPLYHDTYLELAKLPVFEHLVLYSGGGLMMNEARGVRAEGLIEAVTPGFFEALGLRPHLGRFFNDRDFIDTDSPAVIISYVMWQRLFAGDPNAIGERILINAHPMTVVGVTSPEFKGFYVDSGFGFSVPITVLNRYLGTDPNRPVRGLQAVGRLRDGTGMAEASAVVQTAWQSLRVDAVPARLPAAERRDIANSAIKVESLSNGFSSLRTRFGRPLALLLAATVVLLIIGCVNLSALMLARTASREQQFTILLALGAPRSRFIQQVLAEGVVLSLAGTIVGLPFAFRGTALITDVIWTGRDPIGLQTSPDSRVLLITIAAAVLSGLLIAALPAARASRRRTLGLRPERATTPAIGFAGRGMLVVQIALSLVLLVGAGLFARTLWNLRHIDGGFAHSGVRWARLTALPGAAAPKDLIAHYTSLVRAIEELPEIESVTMGGIFPTYFNASQFLTRQSITPIDVSGSPATANALTEMVVPRFFETIGVARQAGRDFSWSDTVGAPPVAIINQSLAATLFSGVNALGRHIRVGTDPKRGAVEIVGIVGDASIGDLRDPHVPVVYLSRLQETMQAPVLLFRARQDPLSAQTAVQNLLATRNYDYPRGWYSIDDNMDATLVRERLLAALSAFLAITALVLAFVGVYGLLSFSVSQRARELGIRVALGATPSRVRQMFIREGLIIGLAGVGIGVTAAVASTRVAASLLFGIAPADPSVLISAAVTFVVVAISAVTRPAIRASRLDPVETLRSE